MDQGQVYNSKQEPQWLNNKTLGFNWDGHMYTTCNITKIPGWLIFLNHSFSLVTILTSISWSLPDLSQQNFIHACTLPIYTCHTPHILWKNPQAYTIQYSVQQGRNTKIKCMPISYELYDKSMRFKSILPKSSPRAIYKPSSRNTPHFSQKYQ